MRRVEITENVLRDGSEDYHRGDVTWIDDEKAAQWISLGWAKDVETGEQGERKPGAQPIKVNSVTQSSS